VNRVNKLINNYRFHVEKVVNGRTFSGILHLGLGIHLMDRRMHVAGSFLREVTESNFTEAKAFNARAKEVLRLVMEYDDEHEVHGRTIVAALHKPDRYGKSAVLPYVPCEKSSFVDPILTPNYAGYTLLDVVVYMQRMAELNFAVSEAQNLLQEVQLYDFDK
jgi:hypothetical protein